MSTPNMPHREQGIALLITVLLTSLVLFMMLYFLNFTMVEKKISSSQLQSNTSYYLAESAINDIIGQLNKNYAYRNYFNSSSTWQLSIARSNVFGMSNAGYTVTLKNSSPAHGQIIATSSVLNPNRTVSQRVIKVNIFRATGTSTIGANALMADGDIVISGSEVTYNGSIHSNHNVGINNGSVVIINGSLEAVGSYTSSGTASNVIVSGSTYGENQPSGPADLVNIPAVDFNVSPTSSLKSMADYIYTSASFNDSKLSNDGLIYVIGPVILDEKTGTYSHRGALVVEGNLTMTYKRWEMEFASGTKPSGIFASGNLTIISPNGGQEGTMIGVIYAGNKLKLQLKPMGTSHDILIEGAVIGKTVELFNAGTGNGNIFITGSSTIANHSLPNTSLSPLISTDHWEEQY